MTIKDKHEDALLVAGIFAILATVISLWEIRLQMIWNRNLKLRKYIIRIFLMIPIYGVESWLGLLKPQNAMYFDVLRECYEAFVIYSFCK
jgi:hypothetical protein